MSNPKISEDDLIELLCGLLQLNRKFPLCLFLCISSWSSVKTLLRCSFLYFLATFTSPRCLHSLFYTSLSSFKPWCVSLQQIWAFFYFPFKLNSASSTCIHHDPLISPAASHLQQSHPISPALLGASDPHLEASGAQMRSKHLSPACSVFVRVKPVFWRENYPLYLFLELKYVIKWFRCSWPINWSEEPICMCLCVRVCIYIYIYIYVTMDHKTSLKSLGYICGNSQKYIVWVKIIDFSFMPKIIRTLSKKSCSMKIFSKLLTVNI